MDLKVVIANSIFRKRDELSFPSKETKTIKFRTEVIPLSSTPKYQKNVFTFENLNLGSRLTLKFGAFHSYSGSESANNEALFMNSSFEGSMTITLTQRIITLLREKPQLDQQVNLRNKNKDEIGRLNSVLKFRANKFEQKIDEDNRMIKKLYYDPFEEDEDVIGDRVKRIAKQLEEKQKELQDALKKLDFIRSANKSVSNELGTLAKEKDRLEQQNISLKKKVDKATSIKELNIQIDLLKNTEAGRDILKEKYAKLLNRLNLERQVYEELSQEYFKIEDKLNGKKGVEQEIEKIKSAGNEQDFHLKRLEDLVPQVKSLKSTIKSQESIIVNLQDVIKENVSNADVFENKEIQANLSKLKHEQLLLREKEKQIRMVFELNEGKIPLDIYSRLRKDEFLMDDPRDVLHYKQRANELLIEVERVSRELEEAHLKEDYFRKKEEHYNNPQIQFEKDILVHQLEAAEGKARTLEREMIQNARNSAAHISELKNKINYMDGLLAGSKYK